MSRVLEFQQTDRRTGASIKNRNREPRIRCPKCQWQPDKSSRWYCVCGHCWNTFDTRGTCPGCDAVWRDTCCLKCHQWSPHDDWYEKSDDQEQ